MAQLLQGERRQFGYLLVHFVEMDEPIGEQIYFSLSDGDDPLRWHRLNEGRPVLRSHLGTGSVRDPHLVRSPDDEKFYLIATDLNAHEPDWTDAVRHGSRAIEVWESTDLLRWKPQRHVNVSPGDAGMTWAPESIWDPEDETYFVHWTSSLYESADHADEQFSKIMFARTRDFVRFSPAKIWLDPRLDPTLSQGVLDSTIVRHDGVYYRFVKGVVDGITDAQGRALGDIFVEAAPRLSTPQAEWRRIAAGVAFQASGSYPFEGPLVFRVNDDSGWYLWADHFGEDLQGYVPFFSTDLSAATWDPIEPDRFELPPNTKHGVVLPLLGDEWQRLHDYPSWGIDGW
jgi:Glycosyl hydrolases family 43.